MPETDKSNILLIEKPLASTNMSGTSDMFYHKDLSQQVILFKSIFILLSLFKVTCNLYDSMKIY